MKFFIYEIIFHKLIILNPYSELTTQIILPKSLFLFFYETLLLMQRRGITDQY